MNCEVRFGKLAEMQFCIDASKRGLNISTPSSDFTGYDLIIEGNSRKLYKIQVKSTRTKSKDRTRDCYKVCISRGSNNKKTYEKNEVDFFAVYLADIGNWYIIPSDICSSVNIRIYPSKPDHKFSSFLEAWHLIK